MMGQTGKDTSHQTIIHLTTLSSKTIAPPANFPGKIRIPFLAPNTFFCSDDHSIGACNPSFK